MSKFTFTQLEKDKLIPKLKQYMSAEFELDLGGFEAEFLLDFIAIAESSAKPVPGLHNIYALTALVYATEKNFDVAYSYIGFYSILQEILDAHKIYIFDFNLKV